MFRLILDKSTGKRELTTLKDMCYFLLILKELMWRCVISWMF